MERDKNSRIHRYVKICTAIAVFFVVGDAFPTTWMLDKRANSRSKVIESVCDHETSSITNDVLSHRYLVVDLSGGSSAVRYPVGWRDFDPHAGWSDEYKTEKLVQRRIKPGTFIMDEDVTNEFYRMTLTRPFYISVFEVTQRQWELVMGTRPSEFKENYEKRPVESVSYDMIRGNKLGARWPYRKGVDDDSFLGILRKRTGLDLDLPTEQQWEYACSAGLESRYYYGNIIDGRYMWYRDNSEGQTHEVGLKMPNKRGLFDMYGNVSEWCVNKGFPMMEFRYGKDPVGSPVGSYFIIRGGNWLFDAESCRTHRISQHEPFTYDYLTFRLCLSL